VEVEMGLCDGTRTRDFIGFFVLGFLLLGLGLQFFEIPTEDLSALCFRGEIPSVGLHNVP
jgi:hypothetical protein